MSTTSMRPRRLGLASPGDEAPITPTSLLPKAGPPSNIGESTEPARCRRGGRLQPLSTSKAWRGNELNSTAEERPSSNSTIMSEQRSEEHTSELQSLAYLVCRLLLEKKKKN